MPEVLTKPRIVDNGSGTTPPMLHWLDPKRDGYALCGWKISKYVYGLEEAECVVCEQMKRGS